MLRFLNLARLVRTESSITRQPSILAATRAFGGSSWLEQAGGKSRKGSKGSGGKGGFNKQGGSKSSKSSGSGGFFGAGNKMGNPSVGNSVSYDKKSHRFTMDLGNNLVARIDYKPIGRNKIELYHTEVPDELRGRGIARALARGALEQAARNNVKVKLSCSYLVNNLDKFADAKLKKVLE